MEISAGFQLSRLRLRIRAFFSEATDPQTDQLSSCINKTKPRKPYTCKSNHFPAPPPLLIIFGIVWNTFCHITFNLLFMFLSILQQPQWPEDYIELNSGIYSLSFIWWSLKKKNSHDFFFRKWQRNLPQDPC